MSDLVGQQIAHYLLEAIIGDGGMGTVYKARDLNLERTVAVKVMHDHFSRQEEFRARLTQEAKIAAQLDHPSVVKIYDFGQYNDGLYIAMEYIGGGSLRAHLKRLQSADRFLPVEQSLQVALQIADALDYAHRQGVIHRDVKPSNVILKRLNRVEVSGQQPFQAVLTDFGLVKLLEADSMTQSGTTMGTPTYMSPEQCSGLSLDGRSDLYSLGVVLYELLTNQLPFKFRTLSEAIALHQRGEMPDAPSTLRSGLSTIFDSLVLKTLSKNPSERYASGRKLVDALTSAKRSLDSHQTQVFPYAEYEEIQSETEVEAYRLRIDTPGREPNYVYLSRDSITLGRNADNDIVLPAEGVSRHHAIIAAEEIGWFVTDLGGLNGSRLNGKRLPPNEPLRFESGSILEVGPYRITLQPVIPAESTQQSLAALAAAQRLAQESVSDASSAVPLENLPLALFLAQENIPAEPGRRIEVQVEVVNRDSIADNVALRIQGLPNSWISLPSGFTEVPAEGRTTIKIYIQVPRSDEAPAGRQRFRVELRSQQHPDVKVAENASLVIGTFEAFEVNMEPTRLKLPGQVRTTIRNSGNKNGTFSVVGRDPTDRIRFAGEQGRILLQPKQLAVVDLQLEPKQRSWFGQGERIPFEIVVTAANGARQVASGSGSVTSLLPISLIYIALFIVVFLCVLSGLVLVFGGGDLIGGIRPSPTTLSESAATGTAAAVVSATADAGATSNAGTSAAATAEREGDRDNDGLSDAQEEIVGTDPDNPDTDADSLSDGEEVLTWGTNPLNRDTDADVLLDGDEVRAYGTSPTNPDTDGDGIPDGVEIATGTDPLDPNDPPPTGTATPVAPTETPSQIPPTDTPVPSAIVTETALPSATPTLTATPTQQPSNTPTITSTPTATATQSAEAPNVALTCATEAPVLDGQMSSEEWPQEPNFEFALNDDPDWLVRGYLTWVEDILYVAAQVNDPTGIQDTDSVKVYFDVNNNAGDPDENDRFFQVAGDGTNTARTGIGTNVDGLDWVSNYDSDNWTGAFGEVGNEGWIVEMQIDAAQEMPDMLDGQPFGLMMLVLYGGDQGVWPDSAISNDPGTWQEVANTICPQPGP